MKSIYILLTKPDTYVSKFIHLTTSDPYTHASISFEENLQPLYSFARKHMRLPLPAGLRIEPLTNSTYEKYNDIPCMLYELRVSDEVYIAAKRDVEQMMLETNNYHYSIIGLLLCKLNIPFNRKHHYFCSEFVGDILRRNKALCLPKEPSLMRPYDYTRIAALSCKFEGNLRTLIALLRHKKYAGDNIGSLEYSEVTEAAYSMLAG